MGHGMDGMAKALPRMLGDICYNCGGLLIRTGTCQTCTQCGDSDGCG